MFELLKPPKKKRQDLMYRLEDEEVGANILERPPIQTPQNFMYRTEEGENLLERPPIQTPQNFSISRVEILNPPTNFSSQYKQQQPVNQPQTVEPLQNAPMSLDEQVAAKQREVADAVNNPAQKQPLWKQALYQGLTALREIASGQPQEYELLGNAIKNRGIIQKRNELGVLQDVQKAQYDANYQKARTQNELNKPLIEQTKLDQRQQQIDIAGKRANDAQLNSFYRRNPVFDAENPTPAQVEQLRALGYTPEDVGSYNRNKPIFTEWQGSKFEWDDLTGTFKDTGLPQDKSQTLTDITIYNPLTRETNTYTTTQEKAASLKQSAANMGMQVIAAKDRQESQQKWQSDENEKNRKLRREEMDENKRHFDEQMKLRRDAEKRRDQAAVDRINLAIKNARIRAKQAGYTDDEIMQMFPEQ